jgi:uncharacterized ferritin-like protein (DUF455 family)
MELRTQALKVLSEADPNTKAHAARELLGAARNPASGVSLDSALPLSAPPGLPGRPQRPQLVHPSKLAQRSPVSLEGRAALLHAICHIEFNAINLALDAVWRFTGMPDKFYLDWLQVAGEEALHFGLLRDHLATLGYAYGDFQAHDGLWIMTERTAHSVLARMALVPRTLEARGLDATPPIQTKLRQVGDAAAVAILDVILRDEVGHVAIGNHWFHWLCEREGLEPVATYAALADQHRAPLLRGPFNMQARRAAGFSEAELAALTAN